MLYGIFVLLLSGLVHVWSAAVVPAAVLMVAAHEALVYWSRKQEMAGSPYFVHDQRGLRILGVIPNTSAANMGLLAGEIIHKVNGVQVRTKAQLHESLQVNPAYCKLEVINLDGQSKFVSNPLFSGQHHQLGIILSPDEKTLTYMEMPDQSTHLWAYLRSSSRQLFSGASKSSKEA
ncbi:MAG: hypothetical protein A2189_00595 [Paenibacillus sp. RIFOXYA1_FULL_44_5]|nr:MAG: hypothetical protein A2189_00595 [Paenibacillus sp. RIFOXYA1_FULL_44_5]